MMPSGVSTPKLDLLRIQETWQFGDGAFNRFIDDADNKLVGIAHLESPMHWTEWTELTAYHKDDVVRYPSLKSHQYARCLQDGTSDEEVNIPTNDVTGSIITDGTTRWEVCSLTQVDADNGTIRIWLGGGVYYHRGDAVRYGDALYRAKIDHESSATFDLDENKWQEIYASIRFWKPNIYYYLDDTVIYDDIIYKCIEAHKSVANFESDSSATPPVVGDEDKWEIIGGAGGAKDWTADTKYQYGQLVLVNGILYRCNTKHKSNATAFQNDISKWDLVEAQIHDWKAGEYYVAGTLVAYNDIIYKCQSNHLASADFETDISNWTLYHNHIIVWDRNKAYYQGQIILYENRLYKCNITHVSPNEIIESGITRNATFLDDISNFDVIYASLAVWTKNTVYKVGDIILYNNEPFRCVKNHTSGNTNTSTIFDDITDNVSTNCWEYIGTKNAYIFPWHTDTNYNVNQFVTYNNTLYKCNTLHKSASTFDAIKWDLVYANIQPWTTGIAYKVNSAVLNDGHLYICTTAHTSTVFNNDIANWVEIGGSGAIEDWASGVAYAKDDVVLYNGILYRNNAVHTSVSTFANDATYWDIVYASIPTWATNVYYPVNMIVSYNNLAYKCVSAHTASADFNTDIANWILYNNSITSWAVSTSYRIGQIVSYNNLAYICTANHVSSSAFNTDIANWILFDNSIKYWATDTAYKAGQIVLYDGVLYVCNVNHISATPFDVTKWDFAYSNIRTYANNTIYKIGSEVIYNKDMYRCKESHTSNTDSIKYHFVYFNNEQIVYGVEGTPVPNEQTIDMGQEYDIVHMYMYEGGQFLGIDNLEIWGSTDGIIFTQIYHYIQPGAHWGWSIQFDCLATARYLKFIANHYQGGYEAGSAQHFVYITNLKVGVENPYWDRIGNYLTTILDWQAGYLYHPNDIVMHDGELYRCIELNLSLDFTQDSAYWESVNSSVKIATKAQIDALFI